jgi:hypothetical protein
MLDRLPSSCVVPWCLHQPLPGPLTRNVLHGVHRLDGASLRPWRYNIDFCLRTLYVRVSSFPLPTAHCPLRSEGIGDRRTPVIPAPMLWIEYVYLFIHLLYNMYVYVYVYV